MNDQLFGDWIDEFLNEQLEDDSDLYDDAHLDQFTEDYGVNGYE